MRISSAFGLFVFEQVRVIGGSMKKLVLLFIVMSPSKLTKQYEKGGAYVNERR